GLSPSERLDQWKRLRLGDTPIAVGARSALFAPLEKLGLIVIDEEHDSAYKNDEGFRYHARTLAMLRARRANCPLILGSATPAIETRHQAEEGEIRRLVLPRRIQGRPLPRVEFVDLVRERERAPRGRKVILTRPLRRALIDTVEEGGQAILFLNRRGFATQIFCFDCGHAERCKNCDVALVYHATTQELRCHYCDYNKPPPEACEGCGAPDTALLGVGTERLEEEVRTLLPNARLARLDRDTAQRRGYTKSVLDGLQSREVDILLGTQMVAKGHDFPGVRLVGVILADLGLHLPDFRAAERTFQLLTQVAGRAGRASEPGRVLVQTFVPDHYAISAAGRHDYDGFYEAEIRQRAALCYPPFSHLTQVMVAAPDEAAGRDVANSIAARVREGFVNDDSAPEVLGPAPAPIPRLRGKYRFQLLLKTVDPQTHLDAARLIAENTTRVPRTVQVSLDVNPVNML
ncbi:MAG: primosomal protein N', partial [Myxococcota bacterium]